MSKSILQEVATFNAEKFNDAQLRKTIEEYASKVDKFQRDNQELSHDTLSNYKLVATNIVEETSNSNNLIDAKISQLEISSAVFEEFIINEFSINYKNTGVMRKDYGRRNIRTNERIDQMFLYKLEDFEGPIMTPIDGTVSELFDHYNDIINNDDINRTWIWIHERSLYYQNHKLLTLDNGSASITIGDIQYKTTNFPGDVNIVDDLATTGVMTIVSPLSSMDSITVNGNIISTDGYLNVNSGMSTTNGDIEILGTGDIKTASGNISATGTITTGGDISTSGGGVSASSGYTTETGGLIAGEGSFETGSGNFISEDGYVSVTQGFTSTNGNIQTGGSGDIITEYGNFTSPEGDLILTDGSFDVGNNGAVGNNLTVAAKTITEYLDVNDMARFYGISNFYDMVTLESTLYVKGNISQSTSASSQLNNLNVTGTFGMNGDLTADNLTATAGKVTCQTLQVNSTSQFSGAINAGGQTITASYFTGTAASAEYADLAEKYETDNSYEPGTVLSIGIDTEVTLYNEELPYAGVVSSNPGYILNSKLKNSIEVALTGRVPVKTLTDIKRGSYIVADCNNPGYGKAVVKNLVKNYDLIGISVNDSNNGLVEVKV